MAELNLYGQYLASTEIRDRLAKVGLTIQHVMIAQDFEGRSETGLEVSARVSMYDVTGNYLFDKDREDKANEFLELFPSVSVRRASDNGYPPEVRMYWLSVHGISVEVNFGSGVCEKVQVGTRKVSSFDPDALAALPRVEVEEPIWEYVCP